MYEVALNAEGAGADRLMWQGDLFEKIIKVQEEWDSGFGFGVRDMQTRISEEAKAEEVFRAVKEIMSDSGLKYDLSLYELSYDEELDSHQRDGLILSVESTC